MSHVTPPVPQKPVPSVVCMQKQLGLLAQTNWLGTSPQLKAQWQLPFSKGVPPILRHLRRALRLRASAVSAKPMLASEAPSTLYPAHLIAWRLEMSFSASPLASSSRSSNTSTPPFV